MGRIRIGLSGWSYDGWRGSWYPEGLPRRSQLPYVAERFDTIELNASFYSLRSPDQYRGWAAAVPPDFVFAVKGSRFITHNKKLRDTGLALANFLASGVLALGDRLGPILWQLPDTQRFDAERLEGFLAGLPKSTREIAGVASGHDHRVDDPLTEAEANHRVRHVLEVRHGSWFVPEAVRLLRRHGVALAVSDAADWPRVEEVTAGFVYVRLHGAESTYGSRYSDAALDRWAERLRAWRDGEEPEDVERITDRPPPPRKGRDVYLYFDNDQKAQAPHDAERLLARLEG